MNLTRFVLPAALALMVATPALAGLGADATSVQADLTHMKGSVRVTEATGFSVHEISTSYGLHVREYTGADGKVFAVAWDGPINPELHQVLGTYYDQFVAAAAAAGHGNHRHLAIEQPGLVVQNSGRMRAFSGRAWVPGMLPQNFTVEQIQ
jgi:Protein of unknown function (DUF2844)